MVYQAFWQAEYPNVWKEQRVSAIKATPGPVAAVSVDANTMDIFWTTDRGEIVQAHWHTGQWTINVVAGPGALQPNPGAPLTALAVRGQVHLIYKSALDPT